MSAALALLVTHRTRLEIKLDIGAGRLVDYDTPPSGSRQQWWTVSWYQQTLVEREHIHWHISHWGSPLSHSDPHLPHLPSPNPLPLPQAAVRVERKTRLSSLSLGRHWAELPSQPACNHLNADTFNNSLQVKHYNAKQITEMLWIEPAAREPSMASAWPAACRVCERPMGRANERLVSAACCSSHCRDSTTLRSNIHHHHHHNIITTDNNEHCYSVIS